MQTTVELVKADKVAIAGVTELYVSGGCPDSVLAPANVLPDNLLGPPFIVEYLKVVSFENVYPEQL